MWLSREEHFRQREGSEAGLCWMWTSNSKEAPVAETAWGRDVIVDEVRQIVRAVGRQIM